MSRKPSRIRQFFVGVDGANKSLNNHSLVRAESFAETLGAWAFYAMVFAVMLGFIFVMFQVMWALSGQTQIPLDEIGDALVITPEG